MNYQKTKDKIYCAKHNLEYTKENVKKAMEMELGFGCEILNEVDVKEIIITQIFDDFKGYGIIRTTGGGKYRYDYAKAEFNKILGTPITLEDVLRVIKRKANIIGWIELLKIFTEHSHVVGNEGALYYYIIENWQPGKTFDDQSTETKDFIKDLLK